MKKPEHLSAATATRGKKHSPADPANEQVGRNGPRSRRRLRAIKAAQAIVAKYVPRSRDLVAELIAERREEAARE
jgi:hypothetical protein